MAIGKSAQLVKVLSWLPIDNKHYSRSKVVSIRELFINRMGPLLPSKALHPRAHAAIHLPKILGGYGLGFEWEYKSMAQASPEPTKWFLSKLLQGYDCSSEVRIFSKLNKNVSKRGVAITKLRSELLRDNIEKYPGYYGALTFSELQEKFNPIMDIEPTRDSVLSQLPENQIRKTERRWSNREMLDKAKRAGYLSAHDFAEWTVRGDLFQDLLVGTDKLNIFNTAPFTRTYQKVWDECEVIGTDLFYEDISSHSSLDIANATEGYAPTLFIDTNVSVLVDIGFQGDDSRPEEHDIVEAPIKELYTKGLPDLLVGKSFIGCDRF